MSRLFWVTPGGGLDAGETFEDAARRELREETAIDVPTLGECVLEEELVGRHPDHGEQDILYRARIFIVRLSAADAARLDRVAVERAGYLSYRWWSLEDLERTDEIISPPQLPTILRSVLIER